MNTQTQPVITTKVCTRCGGTGSYSYNLKDGTRCYGCGGTGVIACAPKGQKKIKPTAQLYKAIVGDIIEVGCVLYCVEHIYWITNRMKQGVPVNQQLIVTRLVDDKKVSFYRGRGDGLGGFITVTKEQHGTEVGEDRAQEKAAMLERWNARAARHSTQN